MGFRFRKTIKLLPGVRLNVSKGGVSLSAGPRGASVTLGKNGVYGNVGIPGSGLSYRTRLDKPKTRVMRKNGENLSIIVENDRLYIVDQNNVKLGNEASRKIFRENSLLVRELVDKELERRNSLIEQKMIPEKSSHAMKEEQKPRRKLLESHADYINRLSAWRADLKNKRDQNIEDLIQSVKWESGIDIYCSTKNEHLRVSLDIPELDYYHSLIWKCSINDEIPYFEQVPLSPVELNKRYFRYVCSLNKILINLIFEKAKPSNINVVTSSKRNNKIEEIMEISTDIETWKSASKEEDSELFVSLLNGKYQLTTTYKFKLI